MIINSKDPDNQRYKLPPLLDYSSLAPPAPRTRNSDGENCECKICEIARKSGGEYHSFAKKQTNKSGPAPTSVQSPPAKTLAFCSKCWAQIGKGKPHQCSKTSKSGNLAGILKSTSQKSRAKVTSSTLKKIAEDSGVSTKGGVAQLQTGSKPLPVQIGTQKVKPKVAKFSHENLKKLQTATNLSDNTLL